MTATDSIRVVLNADDFGLAPAVNEAVVDLCRQGIVRSTSLLATGPAADEAMALARGLSELGVGLHLALVHERPAADAAAIPALLDREGKLLIGYRAFMGRFLRGGIPLGQVEREARAQVERMLQAGLRPTHLDSHQHLHLWPPLLELCLKLCSEYGIPCLRVPSVAALRADRARVSPLRRWLMLRAVGRAEAWLKQQPELAGVHRVDAVWGMLGAGHLSEPWLLDLIGRLTPGVHEIMCHPATANCDAFTRHPWGYAWRDEVAALTSPSVRAALQRPGLEITNFRNMDCAAEHG